MHCQYRIIEVHKVHTLKAAEHNSILTLNLNALKSVFKYANIGEETNPPGLDPGSEKIRECKSHCWLLKKFILVFHLK